MLSRSAIGFIAAMLSVLVFHQPIVMLLANAGLLPVTAKAFNMAAFPNAPAALAGVFKSLGFGGWPVLFNSLFWGGLWGAAFGLIQHRLPGGAFILKGLVFGLIVAVLGNWILVPLIKGTILGAPNLPFFAGFIPARMLTNILIQAGFGVGLGLFYGLLRRNA
jgi:hypothetical protein